MKKHAFVLALFLLVVLATGFLGRVEAAVYNLHLVTDNGPDYTDIESFVRSVTERWKTPQEKCIAIWRWGRRSRRQTSCAHDDGRLIWDPILHYNSYGTMNCGVISALNVTCFLQLGYRARYIQLGDHTVSEVSWDGGKSWHLFDSSMSFFCYNHAGEVASCQEIKESHACELSGGKSEPGHYYLYHGAPQCVSHLGAGGWRCAADQPVAYKRTLINGVSSYTNGFSVSKYTQYARFGHRYVLNLLPGQSYTRHFKPLDGKDSGVAKENKPYYYRPLGGRDPDEQHGLGNIRGNGLWVFQPDLAGADPQRLFYDSQNVRTRTQDGTGPNLHPHRPRQRASVVFKVSAANVITSMRIEGRGLRSKAGDVLRLLVSRSAGIRWTPVWQSKRTGPQDIRLRLCDEVAGVTECLVKVEMLAADVTTDVGLDTLKLTTVTQLNRRTLPKLTLGTNRVRLFADRQVESTLLWPPLHAGLYRQTVFQEDGVHCTKEPDGIYKATLGSAVNGKECFATWRLEVPTDITNVTYGVVATNRSSASYVSLQHGFDGRNFSEFFRKSDGLFPFDKQVLHTVGESKVPAGIRRTYLKCAFFCRGGAAGYGMDGIQDLWMRVEHQPRDARFEPFEVTYHWTEHRQSGDVARSHTELIESLPHEYVVHTAGFRDPTMNWVRMNVRGYDPERKQPIRGYSDGEDVGPGCEHRPVTYAWGKNLAKGKPYTTSRPSSTASKNPDTDGRELTNGIIVAPTDYATGGPVQAATAFWAAGDPVTFVVDLGSPKGMAGVRISTHQPNIHYWHPSRVEVAVSADGKTWKQAGTIRHNDLWKPPGDYEPWEHDDDPSYDDLPAGGRLAYSYPLAFDKPLSGRYVRLTCTRLDGKGLGLSELEVFDRVTVRPWP
ncbi:MAG TPA: discoidin domain-containing protein [Phycisphaerae bacterium]|nr:discoidin domain-containing protein [Phycisphaerae bacterium]